MTYRIILIRQELRLSYCGATFGQVVKELSAVILA